MKTLKGLPNSQQIHTKLATTFSILNLSVLSCVCGEAYFLITLYRLSNGYGKPFCIYKALAAARRRLAPQVAPVEFLFVPLGLICLCSNRMANISCGDIRC